MVKRRCKKCKENLPWLFLTPQSTGGAVSSLRPLEGVAGLTGVCHGVPVCRVIVCHVTIDDGHRFSTVDGDAGGWRRLPHPNLRAGGVVGPQEVVTPFTLVVGDLPVVCAHKLCLPVGHVLRGLADDRPAPVLSRIVML